MLDVSITIISWNTKELLRNCLNSIYDTVSDGLSYEVIVIDNASADSSAEMVGEEFPQVGLVKNIENVGFARANNQAVEIAKGEYILLLNSDAIILERALNKMISFMNEHLDVAVVGCRLLNEDRSPQPSFGYFPTLWTISTQMFFLDRIFPKVKTLIVKNPSLYSSQEVDWVTGACFILRREALGDMQPFDPNYFMYLEEVDLCYRIKQKNFKIFYLSEAEIIHLGGASIGRRAKAIAYTYENLFYFFKKHYSSGKVRLLKFIIYLEVIFKVPLFGLLSIIPSFRELGQDRLRAYLGAGRIALKAR